MELIEAIEKRRNIKPESFNGKIIPENQFQLILEAANWAPTHGRTEPWRFFVFGPENRYELAQIQRDVYTQNAPADTFSEEKAKKFEERMKWVSHAVVIGGVTGAHPSIPAVEEIQATAIAVQNMWLRATDLGIAAYWGSGGPTYYPEFKKEFGLREQDFISGFLYFGYTDSWPSGSRKSDIEGKVTRF
jgi:nitroreductase